MSHTINYGHLQGQAKIKTALKDIQNYLGLELFTKVDELMFAEFSNNGKNSKSVWHIEMSLMMAGIEGYPVQAWIEHCWDRVQDAQGKI
jgi:hypothetical protein